MRHFINEHEVLTLLYCPDINRFSDGFGSIIHDIFRLVTPGQLMIFREYKNIYVVPDITNSFLVELIYPDEEAEYDN